MKIVVLFLSFLYLALLGCTTDTENESNSLDSSLTDIAENAITKDKDQINQGPFFVVYSDDEPLIFDSLKTNQECYLINTDNKSYKRTRTTGHKIYRTDIFEKQVTLTDIQDTSSFNLLYFDDSAKMKWISSKRVHEKEILEEIQVKINLDEYGDLFSEFGGPISQYKEKIKDSPVVEKISFNNEELYLITFKLESYENYIVPGPIFLYDKEKVFPLTGPCSNDKPNLFSLNDKLYIHTGSNCCDCGITVVQLYEYSNGNVRYLIEDGSWST